MTEICSEKNMQVQQRPGRLLRDEDVAVLESLQEETSGYFEGMIEYLERFIESGIEEGRFSEEEARAPISKSPSGMPMPATMWTIMNITI